MNLTGVYWLRRSKTSMLILDNLFCISEPIFPESLKRSSIKAVLSPGLLKDYMKQHT